MLSSEEMLHEWMLQRLLVTWAGAQSSAPNTTLGWGHRVWGSPGSEHINISGMAKHMRMIASKNTLASLVASTNRRRTERHLHG